jgi:hypothetical protein
VLTLRNPASENPASEGGTVLSATLGTLFQLLSVAKALLACLRSWEKAKSALETVRSALPVPAVSPSHSLPVREEGLESPSNASGSHS